MAKRNASVESVVALLIEIRTEPTRREEPRLPATGECESVV
jgi:hypothetical protein